MIRQQGSAPWWIRLTGLLMLWSVTTGLAQTTLSLPDGLKKLNQKRGIYFLYDPQLLTNRRVTAPTDWTLGIETLLTQLLLGTGLSFRKVGDCYLIEALVNPPVPVAIPLSPAQRFTVSGYVTEQSSGEHVAGATVFVAGKSGTITNNYGYFALVLPATDALDLIVSVVGYQRAYRRIRLDRNVSVTIDLANNEALNEVVLTAEAGERATASVQTSQHNPTLTTVGSTPAVAGEKDVLKTLQLLPGIQKGLDGQVGLYVRGGGADQNLLILDEAPVYNANHLFGFFSAFNTDALKSVVIQKGGFSARYGGRLSSVVEMNMREGNRQQFGGEVGTGIIASRLLLEGPIVRNRASFHLTARRSNIDPLLGRFVAGLVNAYTGADWKANFYDLNAKVNADLNPRNQLYLSAYMGRDFFGGGDRLDNMRRWENTIGWGNATGTLRWNHLFSERLFANLSLIYSQYDFATATRYIPDPSAGPTVKEETWRHFNRLTDYSLKYDLDYFPRPNHQLRMGFVVNERSFQLNGHEVSATDTAINQMYIDLAHSLEASVYAEDNWVVNNWLRLNLGGRVTHYRIENQPFWRAEPRLSLAIRLNDKLAIRTSYAEMNQFVHQLTNTGQGLPTDLWVPANARAAPQRSRQVALALVGDVIPHGQLTVEAYQKQMTHIIGYHPNADFIGITNAQDAQNIRWERNVTTGTGNATGVEVLFQRKTGRLSGWVSYTWAITHWRFDELNNGRDFYPIQDRRHTLTWNATYALTPSLRLSGSWQFSTGNPQSVAVLRIPSYTHLGLNKPATSTTAEPIFGTQEPFIVGRQSVNSFRAEPSHRLDLGASKMFTAGRLTHRIEATLTNVYARRNPFYYQYHPSDDAQPGLKRVSLFQFIPSINYSLRF